MQSNQVPVPGSILVGKYQVERLLGQGGMGVVVAARHLVLDEKVAIKFLLPEVAQNAEVVRRFLREAQSAVKIRSEHVARVIDVGTMETGQPYIVMEYLAGADLSEVLLRQGPLPMEEAIEYVLHTCEALADAHSLGIVHRDIKPANLFLTTKNDGTPSIKVLDFGISKIVGEGNQGLTRTRGMMGSPLYMSPEQLNSAKDVDHRVDVYALGVVLFELLTGRQPFEADELPQLIVKILGERPAQLRTFRQDLPPALEVVVERCLAKSRDERIPSVADLARELTPFASLRAVGSAERAARIVQSRTDPNATEPGAQASTLMPLGGTKPPTLSPPRSRAPYVFGGIVLGALLLGGAAFAALQFGAEARTSTAAEKTESDRPKGKTGKDDPHEPHEPHEPLEAPKGAPSVAKAEPSTSATTTVAPMVATTNVAAKHSAPTTKPTDTAVPAPKPSASTGKPKDEDPFGTHVY